MTSLAPGPTKRKKPKDQNRAADILFSKVIRARGKCERCGGPGPYECAHIVRRRFLRTRWEYDNAWCLCRECHRRVDEDAMAFGELVNDTIGEARFSELYALAHDTRSPKPNRAEVRARLRADLAIIWEAL